LKHRQFGVFVTTSYFARQAYEEVRQDAHPVVLVCGRDIVEALRQNQIAGIEEVKRWLSVNFLDQPVE
jgi:hypothetical protein